MILDIAMQIRALQAISEKTMESLQPVAGSGIHSLEAIISQDGNALVFVAVGKAIVDTAMPHLLHLNEELQASAKAREEAESNGSDQ